MLFIYIYKIPIFCSYFMFDLEKFEKFYLKITLIILIIILLIVELSFYY